MSDRHVESSKKRRRVGFTAAMGVALIVLPTFAFTASRRHERDLQLIQAVRKEDTARVRALLADGADPNTLLHPPPVTLGTMLQTASHLDHAPPYRMTLLMYAVSHCNEQIVCSLLEAGAKVRDLRSDPTPLEFALRAQRRRNFQLLVEHGADVNEYGHAVTPLVHVLTQTSHLEDVRFLLAHGANPDGRTRDGTTPLLYAAGVNDAEAVPLLLRAGASIDVRGPQKKTALMLAAGNHNTALVALLLKEGADPKLWDENGDTAENLALKRIPGHSRLGVQQDFSLTVMSR